MKTTLSILICLLTIGSNHSCFVKEKGFKGYVFNEEHFVFFVSRKSS